MEENAHATIAAANDIITAWINGSRPHADDAFDGLRGLCHRNLTVVSPSGACQDQAAIFQDLRAAHGRNADFRIATPREHTRLLFEDGKAVIAEVIELQAGARAVERPRHARRITMICLKDAAAPHGLLIWRLHESIMPPAEEAGLNWSVM